MMRIHPMRKWLRQSCHFMQSNVSPLALSRGLAASTARKQEDPQGQLYRDTFKASVENPEEYWGKISENTVWTKPWSKVLDNSNAPFTKWFVDGRLSLCYNAVDRHVDEGNGDRKAVIWDSPITVNKKTFTYAELQKQVTSLAGLLCHLGVNKGDRVLIYMPMIPETILAMLATIRLGAIHTVVFGGFAAKELSVRIRHSQPKVILTASCGIEPSRIVNYKWIMEEALGYANAPEIPMVVYQRPQFPHAPMVEHKDFDWKNEVSKGRRRDCVDVDSNDPLYVLYTSGTTGEPKGVQHPTGGHAVVNKWTMETVYGIKPGDVWWTSSDLGWVVGHEYICYSPLLNGNTTILYEGKPVGTPNAAQYFRQDLKVFPLKGHIPVSQGAKVKKNPEEIKRVIAEHKVNGFFTAPTALRGIMREDPNLELAKKYDGSSLKNVFVAGELCDDETKQWAKRHFKVPIVNHWWQTETGHAITSTCVGLENDPNQPRDVSGFPVPGFDVKILDDDGNEAPVGEIGRIACKMPLPPGTMSTLYLADERFSETYFSTYKGYYDTMDAGYKDEHGYITIIGRDDDVINVSGHRLSTSAMEEAVLECQDISDCAVVGIPDKMKGLVPLALYVKKEDSKKTDEAIADELIASVRKNVGPVAAFRLSVRVDGLPRTRSGKTARKSIADMATGRKVKIPPTIEDASVYKKIKEALEGLNLGIKIQDLPKLD